MQSLFKFQKENVEYVNTKELFENDSRLVYSDRFHQKVMPNVSSVHIPVEIYNGGKDFLKMLLYKTESQCLHAVSSLLDNSQIGLYTQQKIKTSLSNLTRGIQVCLLAYCQKIRTLMNTCIMKTGPCNRQRL